MRRLLGLTLGILAGCSGGHPLDDPIKTCKAVTLALTGDSVWHSEIQTEQKGVQLQVTLDFTVAGAAPGEMSQAVCIYGLSSQDMDYRNAMGEYANTPTSMVINGMPVPRDALMQAIDRATLDAASQLLDGKSKK